MSRRTQLWIEDGLIESFDSGAYREIDAGAPLVFPLSVIWWESAAKLKKILQLAITRNVSQQPTTLAWQVYDTDGVTVTQTFTDVITYSGVRESNRTRTIA